MVDTVIMSVADIVCEWKPRLKDIEMSHVEEQRLRANVRSELVRARDERAHRIRVHSQVGQAAATHNVLWLGDDLADPRSCTLEREGALLELLVKLFVLIVYAVLDDHRGVLSRRALATSMRITLTRLGRNSS